jgi:squalene cyclase
VTPGNVLMIRRYCWAILVLFAAYSSVGSQEPSGKVRVAELSPQTEQAIEKGIHYLLKGQAADGGWGRNHRVAHTALALMAFMVKGYLPEQPPHGAAMSKGIDFLLISAREGGGYMGSSMYEHGLATLALSEAWGMSSRSEQIRDTLKRAIDVILRSQNPQGGWRYQPRPETADISITVMQIVALASAKEAGMLVPDQTIERALKFVKSLQNENGGFGYTSSHDPGFARTAAGVTSLLMCGDRESPAVQKGLQYLRTHPAQNQWFIYGHYYAVQAMYQAGETYYQQWYPKIRDTLLQSQKENGAWGDDYQTPMAILILGVPYRFLPIYQR